MIARFSARRVAMPRLTPDQLLQELAAVDDLLIVQDLDGVCMQLVKDPLTRRMDRSYVEAAALLKGAFVVLTNGEHERRRRAERPPLAIVAHVGLGSAVERLVRGGRSMEGGGSSGGRWRVR